MIAELAGVCAAIVTSALALDYAIRALATPEPETADTGLIEVVGP